MFEWEGRQCRCTADTGEVVLPVLVAYIERGAAGTSCLGWSAGTKGSTYCSAAQAQGDGGQGVSFYWLGLGSPRTAGTT